MVMRAHGEILRTQPTHRNGDGSALPVIATEDDFSDWERWMEGHKNLLREELIDGAAYALAEYRRELGDMIAAQARQINELELKLAAANGAIDVLRGRGMPGGFNVRGTFDPDALYLANDVCAFNGSSFIARKDNPGRCPGDGWQLLASAGRRGGRGERGPIGPVGAAGASLRWLSFDPERMALTSTLSDGTAGPELRLDLIFAGVDVDPATYSVNFKMLDGSELRFSLRALFAQFFDELKGR